MKYLYIPNFIVYLGASASSTPIKGQTRTLTTAYATFEVATGYLDTQCCCMFTYTASFTVAIVIEIQKPDNCRDRMSSVYSFTPITHYAQFRQRGQ